jgi:hypothetical protein
MDIAAMSTISSQANVSTAAGIDVEKMALNSNSQSGAQLVQMLSQPQDPNLGKILDVRA